MSHPARFIPASHAAVRAEMRALHLPGTMPVPAILMCLLASACTASALLTLVSN